MVKKHSALAVFFAAASVLFAQVDTSEFVRTETPPPVPPVATEIVPLPPSNGGSETGESGESIKAREALAELLSNNEYSSRHLEPYRRFTLSSGFSMGLASDFMIGVHDIFAKGNTEYKKNGIVSLDLNDIAGDRVIKSKGLNLYAGVHLKPFSFAWNGKNNNGTFKDWGWGFSTGTLDGRLDINISRDLLLLITQGNKNEDSYSTLSASGAVFAETFAFNYNKRGIYNRLSFSMTPAHYLPLAYFKKSDITVHIQTRENPSKVLAEYSGAVDIWSSINFDKKSIDWRSGGIDLTFNAELAVFSYLDMGLTGYHIPVVPAYLTTFTRYKTSGVFFEGEGLIDTFSGSNIIAAPRLGDAESLNGDLWIVRPIRIDSYFLIRPFRTDTIVLKPDFGVTFCNPSGEQYVNYGIEGDFNAGRWFTLSFFTGTYDGLFHNKLKLDFHWRLIQLYTGLELSSQDLRRSWELKGAAIELGFAVGF